MAGVSGKARHPNGMLKEHDQRSIRRKRANTQGREIQGKPVQNVVLQQMPESEFLALKSHLQFAEFRVAEQLERQGNPIDAVYFLNRGVGSMVIETCDARSVEVGLVGCEDMIGLPAAGGLYELTYGVVIQSAGDGFRLSASSMKRLLPSMPELSRMLLRRLAIRSVEQAQNTACNRLHSLTQRLARWLLLTQDRQHSDEIATTHNFLSNMVGTDRATVSVAIGEFDRKGILRRGRGAITITDRRKLREESCECYDIFSGFNAELGLRT
jgi:CRP-like cAMP-binding protein